MKYKLINTQTKEEHLCDKITIDKFDYYVNDEYANYGHFVTDGNIIEQVIYKDLVTMEYSVKPNGRTPMLQKRFVTLFRKIIACNNPHIDIPKIIEYSDILEDMAVLSTEENEIDDSIEYGHRLGFINGYNKSQETHPFSEEDMIEFCQWVSLNTNLTSIHGEYLYNDIRYATEELLELWKEQKPKTIYYE